MDSWVKTRCCRAYERSTAPPPDEGSSGPHWGPWLGARSAWEASLEPLGTATLQRLSWKVAFLLAVTSARRVGELHALSVSAECLQMGPGKSSVTLRPNSSFLPKVLSVGHVNRPLQLSAYTPSTGVEGSGDESHVLCPVRALDAYVVRTKAIRLTDQLFVCYGDRVLGQRLSKQRLSHWLVDTIACAYHLAGQARPPAVVAHSIRGVATSWAQLKGIPLWTSVPLPVGRRLVPSPGSNASTWSLGIGWNKPL